ncbi:S8 family serine peptidase [Anaerosporobacter faecicola]|uniref:S8 family serine peptidase n=1 Tax=Anaerosporobacter faecicola TaxID=2718714 RepID=UPI00143B473B|nr:S8 family serine peptidase [Anaerosporobacter faecicola]
MRKRWLAIVMAATMIVTSMVPSTLVNATMGASNNGKELPFDQTTKEKQSLTQNPLESQGYQAEEEVTVIVELEEQSLLDQYNGTSSTREKQYYTDVNAYLESDGAQKSSKQMLEAQKDVIEDIQKQETSDTVQADVLYHYTAVMNGFAIRTTYGELEKIQNMAGVKSAYVARTYDCIDPNMVTSNPLIQTDVAHTLNYNGEGIAVAILDTGLDTNHEAFTQAVSGAKITKNIIQEKKESVNPIANGAYVNEKVPFSYDYADKDAEVTPSEEAVELYGNAHGTHVAGTVAGNAPNLQGVAPQAQLLIMKVFSDAENGASTENILAGLEDAVKLEADVINMSLGSSSGYSVGEEEGIQQVYDSIIEAGINLSVSAGNSYSSTYENEAGGAFTSNPDTSVVGSPSTYCASTSVASCVNTGYFANYFEWNSQMITYTETATASQPKLQDLDSEGTGTNMSFEIIPNYGEEADYAGIDVFGKIAVVSRGSITFTEKVQYAADAGAIAIMIYNNQEGTINMSIEDYRIPAVGITELAGEGLISSVDKTVTIKKEIGHFDNVDNAKKMSDFSSWGVTPDLKLKPEITAPGENIYSSMPFSNSYGTMSGTSMAAPHIAGSFALVRQYIEENGLSSSPEEKAELANQLLMSTATPLKDENDVYYSPRKQGSGLVQVGNAITTPAYLYVDDGESYNRPKLELSDNTVGVYETDFIVQSATGGAISYDLEAVALTEQEEEGYIKEQAKDISYGVDVQYTINGMEGTKVELGANEKATVHVTITLSDTIKQEMESNFANGEFVEGFIFLTNGEGAKELSIPFMGFYGEWEKAPLMDQSTIYDNNLYGSGEQSMYQQTSSFLLSDDGQHLLGVNPYDEWAYTLLGAGYNAYDYKYYYQNAMLQLDPNKIAISPNGDGFHDTLYASRLSLLRNARNMNTQITTSSGNDVYNNSWEFDTKSSYYNSAIYPTYEEINWTAEGALNNEIYMYTVNGTLAYSGTENNAKSSMQFPITVDLEKPVLQKIAITKEEGKTYITCEVKDNQYVAYVGLHKSNGDVITTYNKSSGKAVSEEVLVNEKMRAAVSTLKFNLTDFVASSKDNFIVRICDYAGNETDFVCSQKGAIVTPSTGGNENDGGNVMPETPDTKPENEKLDEEITIEAKDASTTITLKDVETVLNNKENTKLIINVIKQQGGDQVVIAKEIFEALEKAGKDLFIHIKEATGNILADWSFTAKDLTNAKENETNLRIDLQLLNMEEAKKSDAFTKLLKTIKADGIVVTLGQETNLPVEGRLSVSFEKVKGATKGNKVYIYHVNKEKNKLETIVGGYSQQIDVNGKVTIPVIASGSYVILTEKADNKLITSLANQINVTVKKATIKKGKTTKVAITLPACLQITKKLTDETASQGIGAVKVTYRSTNEKVAAVDQTGKIKAKKAGTATIKVTIKLYNGKTRVVTKKIRVN